MSLGKRSAEEVSVTVPPAKKPTKKRVTAKSLGLTKEEFDSIKPTVYKRELKAIVKQLAEEVNDDWHDGWEEQGETINSWFEYLEKPLQAVLDIGIKKFTGFQHCHQLLKIIEESFRELCACPMRGGVKESAPDSVDLTLDHPKLAEVDGPFIWYKVWRVLLESNANEGDIDDSEMLQAIKDASDAGAELIEEDEEIPEKEEEISPYYRLLSKRKSEWESLPNTIRNFRMRRVIDRRFDGPPSRRTR